MLQLPGLLSLGLKYYEASLVSQSWSPWFSLPTSKPMNSVWLIGPIDDIMFISLFVTRSIRACNKCVYVRKWRPGTRLAERLVKTSARKWDRGQISTSVVKHSGCFLPSKNKVNILNLWVMLLPRAKLLFVFCFFSHFTFVLALLLSLHTCFGRFKISNRGWRLELQRIRMEFYWIQKKHYLLRRLVSENFQFPVLLQCCLANKLPPIFGRENYVPGWVFFFFLFL